jgi:nicotinate-nucleotide adenylyltransferase
VSSLIGLFGGSFNPIHNGHLIVACAIAERLDLQRVLFLPSANPPHKADETLLDPAHRAAMVKLAVADEPRFELSDFDLTRQGLSYTIDTVTHFRKRLGPETRLHWIIGTDSLAELSAWSRVSKLVDACRIITAARAGWEQGTWNELHRVLSEAQIDKLKDGVLETPIIEISSTDIRSRIRRGLSIRFLVPEAVRTYIEERGLYLDSP